MIRKMEMDKREFTIYDARNKTTYHGHFAGLRGRKNKKILLRRKGGGGDHVLPIDDDVDYYMFSPFDWDKHEPSDAILPRIEELNDTIRLTERLIEELKDRRRNLLRCHAGYLQLDSSMKDDKVFNVVLDAIKLIYGDRDYDCDRDFNDEEDGS